MSARARVCAGVAGEGTEAGTHKEGPTAQGPTQARRLLGLSRRRGGGGAAAEADSLCEVIRICACLLAQEPSMEAVVLLLNLVRGNNSEGSNVERRCGGAPGGPARLRCGVSM